MLVPGVVVAMLLADGVVSLRILAPPRSQIFSIQVSVVDVEVARVGSPVALFEAIRRDRRTQALSIREIDERLNVHRRCVRGWRPRCQRRSKQPLIPWVQSESRS